MKDCLRHTQSPYDPDTCQPMYFDNDNLYQGEIPMLGEPPEGYYVQWTKFKKYTSESMQEFQSSDFITGSHGEYDLTQGYFYCTELYPEADSPIDQLNKVLERYWRNVNLGMFQDVEDIRAITTQFTIYDIQSKLYTAVTAVVEQSAAGYFQGTKIEIMPFFMPFQADPELATLLLEFRIIMLLALLGGVCVTLVSIHPIFN